MSPGTMMSTGLIAGGSLAGIIIALLVVFEKVGQAVDFSIPTPGGEPRYHLPAIWAFGVLVACAPCCCPHRQAAGGRRGQAGGLRGGTLRGIGLVQRDDRNCRGVKHVDGMPMSKPFDATTKELLESDPRGWLELLLGRRIGGARVLNVDLSTITTEADTVLAVEDDLPGVIQAIQTRLNHEATDNQAQIIWTATYLLMGLSYPEEIIDQLLQGVQNMKESVTYQKILREGRAEGQAIGRTDKARRLLKRLGSKRLGKPGPGIDSLIDDITDLDKLEQLTDRVLDVQDWKELLGEGLNGGG